MSRLCAPVLLLAMWSCTTSVDPPGTLRIVQQPSQADAGSLWSPLLEVSLEDANGDPDDGLISVSIESNPCEWPLLGTRAVETVAGLATFGDLAFVQVVKGYRLTARSDNAVEATSDPIDVMDRPFPAQGLVHTNTFCTKPNPQRDAESLEYVPEDDVFWLADDDSPSIFAVERSSGAYLVQLAAADFLAAFPDAALCDDGDGDPTTGCSYVNELEHLAYDGIEGALYVMNTINSPQGPPTVDFPAIFKLLRRDDCSPCWSFVEWKPVSLADRYEALVSIDGQLFVAIDDYLYPFDFDAGSAVTTDAGGNPLPPTYTAARSIHSLHYDGTYLWVIISAGLVEKVEWATLTQVASYDLRAVGISTPVGIEVVGGSLYVVDGDPPNDIWLLELS